MLYVLLQEIHEKIASTQEVSIVLTSDHSTPVLYGDHSFEPVPFAISRCEKAFANLQENTSSSFCFSSSSSEVLTDQVVCFDEIEAAKGALGRFSGDQVMSLICKYRDYHHS
jgi:2,3-bisphosphoglycerate-independent phosphoglycerate mutase